MCHTDSLNSNDFYLSFMQFLVICTLHPVITTTNIHEKVHGITGCTVNMYFSLLKYCLLSAVYKNKALAVSFPNFL